MEDQEAPRLPPDSRTRAGRFCHSAVPSLSAEVILPIPGTSRKRKARDRSSGDESRKRVETDTGEKEAEADTGNGIAWSLT